MPPVRLPIGTLWIEADAPPRVELTCGRIDRRPRDWLDRLASAAVPWLALPASVSDCSAGLALEYPASLRGCVPLVARLAEWVQDVAAAVPQVLGLARFTLTASAVLEKHRAADAAVCPALLAAPADEPGAWVLLALPAGGATLSDWARADPTAWAWSSPAALLAGRVGDPVAALGAALHHGLVGAVFPDLLPAREKFARLLQGRAGLPARVAAAARAALPTACQADADALGSLALDCLDPRPDRRPSAADAERRFAALEARLTIDRLARHWDAEGRMPTGDKLRRLAAPRPRPEPEALPRPSPDWTDRARTHIERGDVAVALTTAWNALIAEGPHKSDLYLMVLQRAAAVSPARAEIVAALNRLGHAYPPDLIGEANLLRVAHIRVRYLGEREEDVAPLLAAGATDWVRGVSRLMRAALAVGRAGGHIETSKLCAEGGAIFARMPQGGGTAGRYARGYLSLLDGVAHIGYVAAGGSPDYYSDALNRFGAAVVLAGEADAAVLLRSALQWLGWLEWVTGLTPGRDPATVRSATEALLRAHGVRPGAKVETPLVPAYDEGYLFPV